MQKENTEKENNRDDQENRSHDITRRQFFLKAGATSLATAGGCAGVFGFRYLSPSALYEPSPGLGVGTPDRYPVDSVTLASHLAIFTVRLSKQLYAIGATCSTLLC